MHRYRTGVTPAPHPLRVTQIGQPLRKKVKLSKRRGGPAGGAIVADLVVMSYDPIKE